MNPSGKSVMALFLVAVTLVSCNRFSAKSGITEEEILQTAISTVSTAFAETHRAVPTATRGLILLPTIAFDTPTPHPTHPSYTPPPTIPTFTPLVFSDPSIPLSRRIVYYYPVNPATNPVPEGTVWAVHLFAPAYTDETFTSDTAADVSRALEIILHEDSRRIWGSSELEIVEVTFRDGHADVVIEGTFLAAGDAQPCAASLQILMTVFANPSVNNAAISLNGRSIAGLCIFRSGDPPIIATVNDMFERAAVEAYVKANAYSPP